MRSCFLWGGVAAAWHHWEWRDLAERYSSAAHRVGDDEALAQLHVRQLLEQHFRVVVHLVSPQHNLELARGSRAEARNMKLLTGDSAQK